MSAKILEEVQTGFEKILFGFDLARMQQEVRELVANQAPTMPSEAFGGWSLLSRDGSVADGWSQGHLAFVKSPNGYKFEDEQAALHGVTKWISDYKIRTSLCVGYFGHVMDVIEARGFNPRRARITVINPGHSTDLHVDSSSDAYSARLHIPLITNPGCFFEYAEESLHMPADGNGVVVKVSRLHRALNKGTSPRYHLLMDIFDFQGATRFNRFDSSKERLVGWRSE